MNRPAGMSLLDYLWITYGNKGLASSINDPDGIVTTDLLLETIKDIESNAVFSLKSDNGLKGLNKFGEEISFIDFINNGTNIALFDRYTLTEEDSNIGNVGDPYYRIVLNNGNIFYAPITQYSGDDSDTISTKVINNRIVSNLKINNTESKPTVDIINTEDGILAKLRIDKSDYNIDLISIDGKGLHGEFKWENTNDLIRFVCLKLDDYLRLNNPDKGTVYFITDLGKLILNSVSYGSDSLIQLDEVRESISKNTDDISELNKTIKWYEYE